jgi:hypothetical protein
MEKFRKKHYIIAGVLLLFVITNPSRTAFTSFLGVSEDSGGARKFNGLFFSLYQDTRVKKENGAYKNKESLYLGILANFIRLSTTTKPL